MIEPADLTPQECTDLWHRADYLRFATSPTPEELDWYVAAMRDTLAGRLRTAVYAVDDMAASSILGTIVALLFFGWRPREARAREAELRSILDGSA